MMSTDNSTTAESLMTFPEGAELVIKLISEEMDKPDFTWDTFYTIFGNVVNRTATAADPFTEMILLIFARVYVTNRAKNTVSMVNIEEFKRMFMADFAALARGMSEHMKPPVH